MPLRTDSPYNYTLSAHVRCAVGLPWCCLSNQQLSCVSGQPLARSAPLHYWSWPIVTFYCLISWSALVIVAIPLWCCVCVCDLVYMEYYVYVKHVYVTYVLKFLYRTVLHRSWLCQHSWKNKACSGKQASKGTGCTAAQHLSTSRSRKWTAIQRRMTSSWDSSCGHQGVAGAQSLNWECWCSAIRAVEWWGDWWVSAVFWQRSAARSSHSPSWGQNTDRSVGLWLLNSDIILAVLGRHVAMDLARENREMLPKISYFNLTENHC